jgi:hypothetical protein
MARIIGRIGDMNAERALVLTRQDDGDIILSIGAAPRGMPYHLHSHHTTPGWEDDTASVEFCSLAGGGGRSPAVMKALRDLWDAIEADNATRPELAIQQ